MSAWWVGRWVLTPAPAPPRAAAGLVLSRFLRLPPHARVARGGERRARPARRRAGAGAFALRRRARAGRRGGHRGAPWSHCRARRQGRPRRRGGCGPRAMRERPATRRRAAPGAGGPAAAAAAEAARGARRHQGRDLPGAEPAIEAHPREQSGLPPPVPSASDPPAVPPLRAQVRVAAPEAALCTGVAERVARCACVPAGPRTPRPRWPEVYL